MAHCETMDYVDIGIYIFVYNMCRQTNCVFVITLGGLVAGAWTDILNTCVFIDEKRKTQLHIHCVCVVLEHVIATL